MGESTTREPHADLLRDDHGCRERFRAGDRGALERVYRTYVPVVYAVLSRGFGTFTGMRDPAERDELAQAVFLTAFEERTRLRYDGLEPYSAFLAGLTRNLVRQAAQRRHRFANVPDKAVDPTPPLAADAESQYLRREQSEVLARFPEQLTRRHEPEIFELYYQRGWSEERCAKHLGVSRYRLRLVIRRVHARMVAWLEQHGITHA